MSWVFQSLKNYAHLRPDSVAVSDGTRCLTYAELVDRVTAFSQELRRRQCRRIALCADNGLEWIIADLAARHAGAMLVPVPPFFTGPQVSHLYETSDIDTVLTQATTRPPVMPSPEHDRPEAEIGGVAIYRRTPTDREIALGGDSCCKVTYTSGSTGTPKGVMLSGTTVDAITRRLVESFSGMSISRHLCTMPLATLLENIAGVYVPLARGTAVCVPSLASLGLYGSSRIDRSRFLNTIARFGAESLILQPQTLRELTAAVKAEPQNGANLRLRFVAVGGAKVAEADLDEAASVGIPAFQGYGLSECASVVALNRPGDECRGSVGRPLVGIAVQIAPDGEILVGRQGMEGYLGEDTISCDWIATGDLGHLDNDGYLHVTGRKKDVFITSFGRNVSPEWPESVLLHEPEVLQACVFGEAMPYNTSVVVPSPSCTTEALAAAMSRANAVLPDYARVSKWIIADEAFSPANGELTPTGKLRREAIAARYLNTPDHERAPVAARVPPSTELYEGTSP